MANKKKDNTKPEVIHYCSFCGKSQDLVRKLVAGQMSISVTSV